VHTLTPNQKKAINYTSRAIHLLSILCLAPVALELAVNKAAKGVKLFCDDNQNLCNLYEVPKQTTILSSPFSAIVDQVEVLKYLTYIIPTLLLVPAILYQARQARKYIKRAGDETPTLLVRQNTVKSKTCNFFRTQPFRSVLPISSIIATFFLMPAITLIISGICAATFKKTICDTMNTNACKNTFFTNAILEQLTKLGNFARKSAAEINVNSNVLVIVGAVCIFNITGIAVLVKHTLNSVNFSEDDEIGNTDIPSKAL